MQLTGDELNHLLRARDFAYELRNLLARVGSAHARECGAVAVHAATLAAEIDLLVWLDRER